jgi:hypothetical protein
VWVSVDNRLFFWNYLYPQEFFEYDALSEVIMSVCLSTPKPGVFVDAVKYILVVATTIEVVILAVTISPEGALRIVPTAYTVTTDNVTVYKLIGSQSGRVFMGGHDGNLYELSYDSPESSWSSMLGIESRNTHKCRKINHTSWNWKKVLLPPVVRSWIENVNESMIDLCIDEPRRLLYCVTSSNRIRVVYLGRYADSTIMIPDDFDLFTEISSFCTNERRGYSSRDSAPDYGIFVEPESVAIAGVFAIPITESRKVNLMVVLQNGFRVCLRLIDSSFSNGLPTGLGSNASMDNPDAMSTFRLSIVFVRGPPPPEAITHANPSNINSSSVKPNVAGWLPVKDRGGLKDGVRVSAGGVYYAQGVFLMSTKTSPNQPESVIGLCEDLLRRSERNVNRLGEPPSLRETVSVLTQSANNVSTNPSVRGGLVSGKFFDMRDSCSFIHSDRAALLRALCTISATPVAAEVKDKSSYVDKPKTIIKAGSEANEVPNVCCPVAFNAGVLNQSNRSVEFGICSTDIKHVVQLDELEQQAVPLNHQRQLICLSRSGVQMFCKLRPIDYLVKFLLTKKLAGIDDSGRESAANSSNNEICMFFNRYGEVRGCAMCIEILSGMHDDVTLGCDPAFASTVVGAGDKRLLREEAFKCLRSSRFGGEPTVLNYQQNSSASSGKDGRVAAGSMSNPNYSHSNVHHGAYLVASRILRPIWLRGIAEYGRLASIWVLADQWLLTCIRTYLEHFRVFLGDYFRNALQARVVSKNGSDDIVGAPGTILDQLRNDFQEQQKRETSQLQLYANEAVSREETSIHTLWRLVSRSIQALNLLDILSYIHYKLRVDVPWREFEGISFRTLVVSASTHDRIKRVMGALIVRLNKSTDATVANAVDHVVNRLTDECFLYFSAGDRYGFEASKLVENIEKSIEEHSKHGSQDSSHQFLRAIEAETDLLTVLLLKASAYWRSLSNVRDTNVSGDVQFCELTTYCNALAKFGDAGRIGLVKLCLAVAAHFMPASVDGQPGYSQNGLVVSRVPGKDDFSTKNISMASWERWLYHAGTELTGEQRQAGLQALYSCLIRYIGERFDALTNHSSAQAAMLAPVISASVTSATNELLSTSHNDVITSLRLMVDEVLAGSSDPALRSMLFQLLLQRSEQELLRIVPDERSRDVEQFIIERDSDFDFQLLYRYYRNHKLFLAAAEHMRRLAHSIANLDISVREKCLQCAYAAAQDAVATNQFNHGAQQLINVDMTTNNLTDLLAATADELVVIGTFAI